MRRKVRVRRPEPKPGEPTVPIVFSVPETGQVTLRFLSEMDTLFAHPGEQRPSACPGAGVCPPSFCHKAGKRFYGYAAAERWRDAYEDWLPCVLEITEGLWRRLVGRRLRGEVWTIWRGPSQWSKKEVTGEHVDTIDDSRLRRDVDVYTVVQRCYGTDQILWGVVPALNVASPLEPSKDLPPLNKRGKKAPPERLQSRPCPFKLGDLAKMTPEQRQEAINGTNGTH